MTLTGLVLLVREPGDEISPYYRPGLAGAVDCPAGCWLRSPQGVQEGTEAAGVVVSASHPWACWHQLGHHQRRPGAVSVGRLGLPQEGVRHCGRYHVGVVDGCRYLE